MREWQRGDALELQIGVDEGRVFLFSDGKTVTGVMGPPVNIASKPAGDLGKPSAIYITEDVARQIDELAEVPRIESTISGVDIRYIAL